MPHFELRAFDRSIACDSKLATSMHSRRGQKAAYSAVKVSIVQVYMNRNPLHFTIHGRNVNMQVACLGYLGMDPSVIINTMQKQTRVASPPSPSRPATIFRSECRDVCYATSAMPSRRTCSGRSLSFSSPFSHPSWSSPRPLSPPSPHPSKPSRVPTDR